MADSWPTETVSDLQKRRVLLVEDGNHGEYRPRRHEFEPVGTSFIRAADMEDGRVLFQSASRINSTARRRIRKGVGAHGDVLLSHKGTVGKVAYVPLGSPPFVCSPQTTFWRSLDEKTLNQRFLYYFLCSRKFQQQLRARKGETDMADYVSLTNQRSLVVPVPPVERQEAVASILGALDDKIELNGRMNRTLEAMARAIFKAWFIDFEPVKAKAAGAAGFPGMPQPVFDQLPDHFTESDLGPIPAGWGCVPISDLVEVVGGGTPSTKNPEFWERGEHPFCTPKDMSKLTSPVLLDTERHITQAGVDKISSGQLPEGTVLLSSRAPIGYLAIAETPVSVNQGIIAMLAGDIPNTYILLWTESNMEAIKARAGGSTFAEISKRNFRPISALRPDERTLTAFGDITRPLFKMTASNQRESGILAANRDSLLPKLISGTIRVTGAEGVDDG